MPLNHHILQQAYSDHTTVYEVHSKSSVLHFPHLLPNKQHGIPLLHKLELKVRDEVVINQTENEDENERE